MNLQKDPLRPLVKVFISCTDAATSVMAQAKTAQLATHVGNVGLGIDAGVNARGDGVLFSRQPKAVVAKGVQHVEALHALKASKHIGADVAQRVTHVKARTRGIGEHVDNE